MRPEQWAAEIMKSGYEGEPAVVVEMMRKALAEEREACARLVELRAIEFSEAPGFTDHTSCCIRFSSPRL